jgi:predicted patatin/cPLA2 family phospholipase
VEQKGNLRACLNDGGTVDGVHGVNPDAAIGLLKERAELIQRGIKPADGRKIGLIVEGGAMRGVISCGALQGLEELGMTRVFDEVYGASAGAVNAAYFLAGQAGYATTIYYQTINTTRFFRRIWHRQVVDLDELFESIVGRERPLNVEKVLAAASQLFIVIADAQTGLSFLAHAQSSTVPVLTLLKASSAMPLLYNRLVDVEGRQCFDGGLINPLPIADAIENGCTDLLVLLTRPASFRECAPSGLEQRLFNLRCAKGNPGLMDVYRNASMHANTVRDIALGKRSVPSNINIATICPSEADPMIERMTRNSVLLKGAAIASVRRTLLAFGYPVEEIIEIIRPFPAAEPTPEDPAIPSESGDTVTAA